MKHKIYTIFMIVIPLFVGSGGIIEMIIWLSNGRIDINPLFCLAMILVGHYVGIGNILKLINEAENRQR